MTNQAVYMTGLNEMEIRSIPVPEVKEQQVLVKLEYVGICGSDVHYLEHGAIGEFVVNGDFILGHECAGTVVEIGKGVTNLKVGDKVALELGITCGQCEFCKSGKYNLCPDVEFLATPPYDGSLMNYIACPENMCFKLPDNISTKEGADIIIETAGSKVTIGQTPYLVKNGGIIVLVGLAPEEIIPFNFAKIMSKEAVL